jgi:lantibiotic modifying enzyme
VIDSAVEALAGYAGRIASENMDVTADAGPAVLAGLTASTGDPAAEEIAWVALDKWLDQLREGTAYPGVFGGLAGFYVGAQTASSFYPGLRSLALVLRDSVVRWTATGDWRTDQVGWADYDLISGPAGMILSLATDPECASEQIVPAAQHLARLCESDRLEKVRIGAYLDDEQRSWNQGLINTGLAHGVTGIAAALRVALEISGDRAQFLAPLRRVCEWLVAESYLDDLALLTWPPAGLEGKGHPPGWSRRQAWCYGTPGISWTLWEAGRLLDDMELQAFAEEAMRSFCKAFQEELYVDSSPISSTLGICHGVAGTLAIADAFATHTCLKEATVLRDRLEGYLLARLPDVRDLARDDMTLLTGASGILSTLLMRQGGQRERAWLTHLALR